jgi:uncharacterized protein (TIGR02186 family)
VRIGTFYDGATLTVTGEVPAGSDVVVTFEGKSDDLHMKRKGKALGLFWMNMGSVTITHAPSVSLTCATRPLAELAAGKGADAALGLGELRGEIGIEPSGPDDAMLFDEFVKLKRGEGLYKETVGNVEMAAGPEGSADAATFTATVDLPSRLAPGPYLVHAVALKDGVVVWRGNAPVQAELVGTPKFIADLAFNHGALFGILATVVAILGGLIIGWLFQGASGAH